MLGWPESLLGLSRSILRKKPKRTFWPTQEIAVGLSHPTCGTLLQQSEKTNRVGFIPQAPPSRYTFLTYLIPNVIW